MTTQNKTKYVDLLEEDKPIANQKFVCVSFVSPEKILKKKNVYYFQEFLKTWDFNKSMEKCIQFLNFISFNLSLITFKRLSLPQTKIFSGLISVCIKSFACK